MPALRTHSRSLEVTTSLSPPSLAIISPTPRAFTFPINTQSDSLNALEPLSESPFSSPLASPFSSPLGTPTHSRAGSPFQFDTHFAGNGFVDGNMHISGLLPMGMDMQRTVSPSTCLSPSLVPSLPPTLPSNQTLPLPSQPLHTGSSSSSLTHKRRKSSHSHSLTRSPTRSLSKPEHEQRGSSRERHDKSERGDRGEKDRRPKKGDEDYIKRPENAFILFRRKCCEDRNASSSTPSSPSVSRSQSLSSASRSPLPTSSHSPSTTPTSPTTSPVKKQRQADLSKTISQQWKALAPEERMYWEELAKEKKREHERMYPGYVYRPQRGGKRAKSVASKEEKIVAKDGNGKESKARKNSMVSIASTDADEDEDRDDEDSSHLEDKAAKTLSFVVPTLPSPPLSSYTQHLSPFDAIATQLSSTQTQGQQAYNRPFHARSASAPTPPPFNTLSPLLQQHAHSPYQSFNLGHQDQYANNQYAQQQGYGYPQQQLSFTAYSGPMGAQMGQQHIQIPNVYNTPNANSCPTSPSPNTGGMNMLPTSPTTDVPMISGARRGSAPGHASTTGEAFESSDFLRGMYNMSGSLPHSLSRKPLSLSTSSLSPLSSSTTLSASALSASPASSGPPSPSSLSSAFERSSLHDGANSNSCGDVHMRPMDASYGIGMGGIGGGVDYDGMGGMIGGMGEEYAGFHGFGGDAYGFTGFSGTWSEGNNHHNAEGPEESGISANGKSLSTTPTPQMFSPSQHDQHSSQHEQQNAYAPSSTCPRNDSYYSGGYGGGYGVDMGAMDMGMGMGVFMTDDFDIAAIQTVEFGLPPTSNPSAAHSQPSSSSSSDASGKVHVEAYEHHQGHMEGTSEGVEYGMNGMNMGMGGMGMGTDMQGAVNV